MRDSRPDTRPDTRPATGPDTRSRRTTARIVAVTALLATAAAVAPVRPAAVQAAAADQVVVYDGTFFDPTSSYGWTGSASVANLATVPMTPRGTWYRKISSFKVGASMRLLAFDSTNFKGKCFTFVGETPDLAAYRLATTGTATWNNRIASVRVVTIASGISCDDLTGVQPADLDAHVFEPARFGEPSHRWTAPAAVPNLATVVRTGTATWDNVISSVKVGANVRVLAYENRDYGGRCALFAGYRVGGTSAGWYADLKTVKDGLTGSSTWDNRISSLKVVDGRTGATCATPAGASTTVTTVPRPTTTLAPAAIQFTPGELFTVEGFDGQRLACPSPAAPATASGRVFLGGQNALLQAKVTTAGPVASPVTCTVEGSRRLRFSAGSASTADLTLELHPQYIGDLRADPGSSVRVRAELRLQPDGGAAQTWTLLAPITLQPAANGSTATRRLEEQGGFFTTTIPYKATGPATLTVTLVVEVSGPSASVDLSGQFNGFWPGPIGITVVAAPSAMTTTTLRQKTGRTAIVSLGDSFISGEAGRWQGNSSVVVDCSVNGTDRARVVSSSGVTCTKDVSNVYLGGTGGDEACHRSDVAEILSPDIAVDAKINLACSGATTSAIIRDPNNPSARPHKGQLAQARELGTLADQYDVQMVVVSIGGNDFGFKDYVVQCAVDYVTTLDSIVRTYCRTAMEKASGSQTVLQDKLDAVGARVKLAIRDIRAVLREHGYRDSDYVLLLQSYPSPIPRGADIRYLQVNLPQRLDKGCPVWNTDADYARDYVVPRLSSTIYQAAMDEDAAFLDLRDFLDGRELCATSTSTVGAGGQPSELTSEWARFITVGGFSVTSLVAQGPFQESIHPNAYAQRGLQKCLAATYTYVVTQGHPHAVVKCTNTAGQGVAGVKMAVVP